jgi:excisionase family DNA binding protein
MRETKQTDEAPLTISVVEAGQQAGLGRNGSYDAAKRGEIPTIRFGRRLRVPRQAWERILNGEAA